MIPRSVSASSLELAEKCLASYTASSLNRAAGFGNDPARLGTALHGALEIFTAPGFMQAGMWDLEFLLTCFQAEYFKLFGANTKSDWYKQGMEILTKWHQRPYQQHDIQSNTVVSREIKESFEVPYVFSGVTQKLPVNYIIDRLDNIGGNQYRVVDYKSQRMPWGPEEMLGKIQPRLYALAIQIKYPQSKTVLVQFDYLRYEPTEVTFSKDDNVDTWRWLKQAVQRIVDTDESSPPETLNDGCRYCIRKLSCNALKSNIQVGGAFSYDMQTLADRFGEMVSQIDGLKSAADNIEQDLLVHAQQSGEMEWFTDNNKVRVSIKKTRRVSRSRLVEIIGEDIVNEFGRVNLGDIETIRADPRLTMEQRSMLETAIETTYGEPSIKVIKRGINK